MGGLNSKVGTSAEPIYLGSAAGCGAARAPDRTAGSRSRAAVSPLAVTDAPPVALSESGRRHAAALIRVDHVGEVCAQALVRDRRSAPPGAGCGRRWERASARGSRSPAWTRKRLEDLGDRTSLLNAVWYAGAFCDRVAGIAPGRSVSLGFVVETERQVEQHLRATWNVCRPGPRLARDRRPDEEDERRMALAATELGSVQLPPPRAGRCDWPRA